jgi:hypothetical protein
MVKNAIFLKNTKNRYFRNIQNGLKIIPTHKFIDHPLSRIFVFFRNFPLGIKEFLCYNNVGSYGLGEKILSGNFGAQKCVTIFSKFKNSG